MKLFINDEEITIFNGATVLDAVRAFYVQLNKDFPTILPTVIDGYDNSVSYDGELTEGNHLYIRKLKTTEK